MKERSGASMPLEGEKGGRDGLEEWNDGWFVGY